MIFCNSWCLILENLHRSLLIRHLIESLCLKWLSCHCYVGLIPWLLHKTLRQWIYNWFWFIFLHLAFSLELLIKSRNQSGLCQQVIISERRSKHPHLNALCSLTQFGKSKGSLLFLVSILRRMILFMVFRWKTVFSKALITVKSLFTL